MKLPAEFSGMGLQSLRRRWRHLPLHKGGFFTGQGKPDPYMIGGYFFAHRRGGYYPPVFNWMGLTPFRPRCGHLPSRGGLSIGGRRRNTSSVCFADTVPSRGRLCPSGIPVIPLPSFSAKPKNPPSPLGRLIASEKCEGTICTLHYAVCIERYPPVCFADTPL